MFRDSQEPLGELTPERKAQIQKEDDARWGSIYEWYLKIRT